MNITLKYIHEVNKSEIHVYNILGVNAIFHKIGKMKTATGM